jgi:hypothetical protein
MTYKPGDIIVTRQKTLYSNYISRFTGSPWTHSALIDEQHKVLEFAINGKRKSNLEDYLNSVFEDDVVVVRPHVQVNGSQLAYDASELFRRAKYDYLVICRMIPKLNNGRDMQDISFTKNRFTCASLIARAFEEQDHRAIPRIHYSQVIPDDFFIHYQRINS